VDQRVPKKLLLENGAPTATDKRAIADGVEELIWLAALKPTTIGVAAYRDETREYLEIAVLSLRLREGAKTARLIELVHRAIPYPVFLLVEQEGWIALSAANKRWSLGEAGQTVLDGEIVTAECGGSPSWTDFPAALALRLQPGAQLYALYQGWIDVLVALSAARLTGAFVLAASPEQSAERREALREHARLVEEVAHLRAAAAKETQIARQVDLNLEVQALNARIRMLWVSISAGRSA
jgi:hypothetical protein